MRHIWVDDKEHSRCSFSLCGHAWGTVTVKERLERERRQGPAEMCRACWNKRERLAAEREDRG